MSLINNLKSFFKGTGGNGIPIAIRDDFSAARARYEESQKAIQPSAIRAKRCGIIWGHHRGSPNASKIYEQESATYTAADFAPYTEVDLDAYTARMETLVARFDSLVVALGALESATVNHDDDFYIEAGACFNLYCQTFKMFARDYRLATLLAVAAAAQAKLEALKDAAKAWIKAGAPTPETEAVSEGEIKAQVFEEKAKAAGSKADAFVAKALEFTKEIDALLDG
jgi:hypothetical protein